MRFIFSGSTRKVVRKYWRTRKLFKIKTKCTQNDSHSWNHIQVLLLFISPPNVFSKPILMVILERQITFGIEMMFLRLSQTHVRGQIGCDNLTEKTSPVASNCPQ